MPDLLDIRPKVAAALTAGRPVVALETTVLAYGLPAPHNLEAARAMERAVRTADAVPATIGLIDGRVRVGLDGDEIARFTDPHQVIVKVSHRDLGPVLAERHLGATTVAATLASPLAPASGCWLPAASAAFTGAAQAASTSPPT